MNGDVDFGEARRRETRDVFGGIVIGVVGRRHIVPSAIPAIENATRRFLRTLEEASNGAEIWFATGLAIGADQLAARIVAEGRRAGTSRAKSLAVLPAPAEEYASDFSRTTLDDSAKATTTLKRDVASNDFDEFRRLCEFSDALVELPLTPENVARRARGEKIERTAQYSALADFSIERSRLLLAFWSGNASTRKPGGTVDVVLRKLERREPVFCVSTPEATRVKNPDGSKTLVPEPTVGSGDVAFWAARPASAFEFDASERTWRLLTRFFAER